MTICDRAPFLANCPLGGIGSEFGLSRRGGYNASFKTGMHRGFRDATLVSSGRSALGLAIRYAQVVDTSGRSKFLLPSYLCESMIQPFHEAGLEVRFYPVDGDLAIDEESIARRVDDKTLGVMLMHYFGFPQVKELHCRLHARFRKVCIIDDRTHLLLSDIADPSFSPGPSIAVYSPRKWGPFPDLGIVVWGEQALPPCQVRKLLDTGYDFGFAWFRLVGLLLRATFFSLPLDALRVLSLRPLHLAEEILHRRVRVTRASPVSRLLWRLWNWALVWQIRRQNYQYLLSNWPTKAGQPLFSHLPRDVCPLGFPIRAEHREELKAQLINKGVYPPIHWRRPPQLDPTAFPDSARLAEEELTLSIDQRYTTKHMEYLLEALCAG